MANRPKRRPRRQFTDEFKAGAVRLVLDEGKTVGAAARDLDLTETALREVVHADERVGVVDPQDPLVSRGVPPKIHALLLRRIPQGPAFSSSIRFIHRRSVRLAAMARDAVSLQTNRGWTVSFRLIDATSNSSSAYAETDIAKRATSSRPATCATRRAGWTIVIGTLLGTPTRNRPVPARRPRRKLLTGLERETGIEPATSSLGSSRSTAELLPRSVGRPFYPVARPCRSHPHPAIRGLRQNVGRARRCRIGADTFPASRP